MLEMKTIIEMGGGIARMAEALGISVQAIYKWKRVPAAQLSDVARITGIPPKLLRPDLAAIFKEAAE